jgi:excisionase family DNA binding protein
MATTTDEHSRLLRLDEAAERLGVSTITVRRRVHSGELPAVRLGPSDRYPIRIDESELERWLFESGELPSGSPIPASAAEPEPGPVDRPQRAGPEGES